MPDVFDAIHARQQPDVFDRIHASQPDKFDQIRTQLEADAARPWYDKAIEGAKSLGSMVAAPIIGIPSAIGQVGEFITDPGSVARRNLNPETAGGLPGAVSSNPLAEAIGSGEAALLAARAEGPNANIHRREIGRLEQAAPAPAETAPEQSSGIVGNIRQAWNLYKKVRKLSPTKLGEAGFEKFLDYVEGETPKPATPAAPPVPPIFDEIARAQAGKSYESLDPATQATIRSIADRIQAKPEPPSPTPLPAAAPKPSPKPAPAASEALTPAGGLTDPAYAPEPMQPPLSLPGGQGQAIPPDVSRATLSPAQELAQSLTGSPEGGTIAPEASPHPPSEAFEGAYRAKRAQILADHLHENGISYGDLANLTPEDLSPGQWEALLGKDPQTGNQFRAPSQKTIDQARVLLAGKHAVARSPQALAAAQELAKPEAGGNVAKGSASAVKPTGTVELHRGGGPGNYYSTSRDFAREFTHSGQDSEISSIKVPAADILDLGEKTPGAGDVAAVDLAKRQAKSSGAKGFYVDEGQGQPRSVFFVESPNPTPAPKSKVTTIGEEMKRTRRPRK